MSDEQIEAISNRFTQRNASISGGVAESASNGGNGGGGGTEGNSPEPLQHQTSISSGLFSEVSKKLGWHKDSADFSQAPSPR